MNKIRIVLTLLLCLLFSVQSYSQKYDLPGNYGIEWKRGKFDTVLYIPITNSQTTPRSIGDRMGAIKINPSDTSIEVWDAVQWNKLIDGYHNASMGKPALVRNLYVYGSNTTNTIFPFAFNHQVANRLNLHEVNNSTTYQTVQRTTLDSNFYSDLQMQIPRIPEYTEGSYIMITNGFEDIRLDSANRQSYPSKFNTQYTTFVQACIAQGWPPSHIIIVTPWFWLNPSFMPSPALTHQERFITECENVATDEETIYVDIFHLMEPYGNALLRSIDTTYPNQIGHDSITNWIVAAVDSYINTEPQVNVWGRVNIYNGGLTVDGPVQTQGPLIVEPQGNLRPENEPNYDITSTDGVFMRFGMTTLSPHAADILFGYEYKNPQNTNFDSSWNPTFFYGINCGINGNQYDLNKPSLTINFDQNIWTTNLIMGFNNPGTSWSMRNRKQRIISTNTTVPISYWMSNTQSNTATSSMTTNATNNWYITNELQSRNSAFWDIYNTRLNIYDTVKLPNTMLGTDLTKVLIRDGDAVKHANVQSVLDGKQATLSTTNASTRNLEPVTDDTYYLGENDAVTPHAYKGAIFKDTNNGNYYRIEVTNGVIVATQL